MWSITSPLIIIIIAVMLLTTTYNLVFYNCYTAVLQSDIHIAQSKLTVKGLQ